MSSVKKVAELAGVSSATVSRALSKPEMVTPETRQKVIDAAAKVGYSGNYLARNLRTRRTSNVIVLVPNIANPFFSEVIRGIERVAHNHGYSVLLGDTQDSPVREKVYVDMLNTKRADGLITLSAGLPELNRPRQTVDFLSEAIVNACECAPDTPMRTVQLDNVGAARKATEHLIGLGHQRIAFISGPPSSPFKDSRKEGYRQALEAAGLAIDDSLMAVGDFSVESGIFAARQLLLMDPTPTAIFCSNDEMALGVIHELKNERVRIPRDISIVGFDNIHIAQYLDPPLTTIAQPMGEIGERAMSLLYEILQGRPPAAKNVVLPFELIVRDSTAKPRSG